MSELDAMKTVHAVVKLLNGEEIICKLEKNLVTDYAVYHDPAKCVILHHPMQATVEQYYEKSDDDDKVSVYEKTIMRAWIRFGPVDAVPVPCSHILLVCTPHQDIIDKYDDLMLIHNTYASNPEFAKELYGTIDAREFYDEMDTRHEDEDDDDEYDDEEDDDV